MEKIGFLIPEFPIQTHAFFMREREELKQLGVETVLISTRPPTGQFGAASHAWAEKAANETEYLYPLNFVEIISSLFKILLSGPHAWIKSIGIVMGKSDLTLVERIKMFALMLTGAYLARYCKLQNLKHIHVHSCANAANVAMFSNFYGGPTYSLTLHGPLHDYGTNQKNKWVHASYCIVITQDLFNEVQHKLGNTDLPPIYLAPMGVNFKDFKRTNNYKPVKEGEVLRLVSCGRLNVVKGHDDLIRVLAILNDLKIKAKLTICGAMDAPSQAVNYQQKLIDLSEELHVRNQIDFLGSVSEQRVKDELENAHLFCLASLKEPLGVATMEAMSMETPAIVTRSPGVNEMIETGVDGVLVDPRSPEQFVKVIRDLVTNPEKTLLISKQGRSKILEKFHSGISARKIVEGLNKVNNSRKSQ